MHIHKRHELKYTHMCSVNNLWASAVQVVFFNYTYLLSDEILVRSNFFIYFCSEDLLMCKGISNVGCADHSTMGQKFSDLRKVQHLSKHQFVVNKTLNDNIHLQTTVGLKVKYTKQSWRSRSRQVWTVMKYGNVLTKLWIIKVINQ